MNRLIHESALRAAAKLALSLGIVSGCGEVLSPGEGRGATDADRISRGDATPHDDDVPATARDAGARHADAAAATDAAVASSDAGQDVFACLALVEDRIGADAGGPGDPEFVACCGVVAEAVSKQWTEGNFERDIWTAEDRDMCCSALDWRGPTACTPWGPPAPPRMDHYAGVA